MPKRTIKDLPSDADELRREYKRTLESIHSYESRLEEVAKIAPEIQGIPIEEFLRDEEDEVLHVLDPDEEMDSWCHELMEKLPRVERVVLEGISTLSSNLYEARLDLAVLRTKATVLGVKLSEEEQGSVASTRKKRAAPEDVAFRQAIVRTVKEVNPRMRGLDLWTCRELDRRQVGIRSAWKLKHRVKSWEEAYKDPKLKNRIHKMFSTDRKTN